MREYLLENYDLVVSILLGILSLLFGFFRTHKIKKEVNELKFKTIDTVEPVSQSFTETKPAYVLNSSTNELERLAVDENVQVKIQSFLETAIERALERFLPNDVVEVDDIAERYNQSQLDLSELGKAYDMAESYREKFGLSDDCSVDDIFAKLSAYSEDLKTRIAKSKEVKSDEVSEKDAEHKKE